MCWISWLVCYCRTRLRLLARVGRDLELEFCWGLHQWWQQGCLCRGGGRVRGGDRVYGQCVGVHFLDSGNVVCKLAL